MNQAKYKIFSQENNELSEPKTILELLDTGLDKYPNPIFLLSYGKLDIYDREIFQGDIITLKNELNQKIFVVCEYGEVNRDMLTYDKSASKQHNNVSLTGFSFRNPQFNTFPINNNYQGVSDIDLFVVVGNVFQHMDLVPWYKERFEKIYNK